MLAERRNAIVTGSAGGLGRALSLQLARSGWRLALADIDESGNAETAAAVAACGGDARCEQLDVTDAAQWQAMCDRLRSDWPRLDLLVNNAGIAGAGCVGDMPLADWHRVLGVNLLGVVNGCHTSADWLKQNPAGAHIVNVASFAAFVSLPEMAAYNVSKAGVLALSETLRGELAPHRVGVTAVCPGFFASGLARGALMRTDGQREFMAEAVRKSTLDVDRLAAAIVEAVAQNRPYVVMPARAWRFWLLKRFAPRFFLRRIAKLYQRKLAETHAQS